MHSSFALDLARTISLLGFRHENDLNDWLCVFQDASSSLVNRLDLQVWVGAVTYHAWVFAAVHDLK